MDQASASRARPRPGLALLLAAAAFVGHLTPAAVAMAPQGPGRPGSVIGGPDAADAKARAAAARRTGSAWLPYWGDVDAAYQDALQHASQLHTVSPFWYEATPEGITAHDGAGRRRIINGLHRAGLKVVPTVTEPFDAAQMADLTHDPQKRGEHVDALLRMVESRAYDGVDLDYEKMAVTGDKAARERVRTGFNALTSDLCARLHARGKECIVTVLARAWGTGEAYDYAHLGKVADRVRIMGYDLHWSGGESGPLSSKTWYEEFLRYATRTLPRHKIEVAFPGYGWDWIKDREGGAGHLTWKEADALRRQENAAYRFDSVSGTPHFSYLRDDEEHEVWYQDARGVRAQMPLLKKYRVRGTGLWALGFEDPDSWAALRGE